MAQPNAAMILQKTIINGIKFVIFMFHHYQKKNPLRQIIKDAITSIRDVCMMKKKLEKIENMIKYEKYKYKKTELILAQNTEHFFLNGRTINQQR